MAEHKLNLSPALLGKAIGAIGVDGITRLHENYVTIVDPDRLAALERIADLAAKLRAADGTSGTGPRRLALYRALARMEADAK